MNKPISELITLENNRIGDYAAASSYEWLAVNGIGGYASGTLAGSSTRRYHGLLVAALNPPSARFVLLSRLEETISYNGQTIELSANQYPGAVQPKGYQYLEHFSAWPAPTFIFRPLPQILLQKQIWMCRGSNTTFIKYTLLEAPGPVEIHLTPLICWKSYHAEMHPWHGFPFIQRETPEEIQITSVPDAPPLRLYAPGSEWDRATFWHNNIEHERERERGLDWREDLYCPGQFHLKLDPTESFTLTATIEDTLPNADDSWYELIKHQDNLLSIAAPKDDIETALTLAADAFVIEKGPCTARATVLAGYHWFTDWGRDTMIALPGLCRDTGRMDVGSAILRSFAVHVNQGMIPNRFPDLGEIPEYNTVDASLWYMFITGRWNDKKVADDLLPILEEMMEQHISGTRYGIRMDPGDCLLETREPGTQLTWMDARVGDLAITPRVGKPVEINALWYNILNILAERSPGHADSYRALADKALEGFQKFVRSDGRGLYDLLPATGDPDDSVRPNQVFAVSLPDSPVSLAVQMNVVDTLERELLTPMGLRTLTPQDPAYRGRYEGGVWERDSSYHQGTVWPWLLGPFVEAHLRVYFDPKRARAFLEPIAAHLLEAGIGSISEVFDGDAPHRPNGCIAQAWSVAEVLRAWRITRE